SVPPRRSLRVQTSHSFDPLSLALSRRERGRFVPRLSIVRPSDNFSPSEEEPLLSSKTTAQSCRYERMLPTGTHKLCGRAENTTEPSRNGFHPPQRVAGGSPFPQATQS